MRDTRGRPTRRDFTRTVSFEELQTGRGAAAAIHCADVMRQQVLEALGDIADGHLMARAPTYLVRLTVEALPEAPEDAPAVRLCPALDTQAIATLS